MKKFWISLALIIPSIMAISVISVHYSYEGEKGREIASIFNWDFFDRDVKKAATAKIETNEAFVMLDNNHAFQSKLDLIRSANESIRMSYFIYTGDHSTSLLTKELIAAAKRGVKVKIIVDYHANYKNLDFFKMIEQEGAPNIQVKLYNRPTKNIVKMAVYLTTPCPDMDLSDKACRKHKMKVTEKVMKNSGHHYRGENRNKISNAYTKYSQMFLTGLYAKDPKLIAKAVLEGQQLDIDELLNGGGETSPEEKEALKELATLYYKSKFGDPIEAMKSSAKLLAAKIIYRDDVMPVVNLATALLPLSIKNDKDFVKDLRYITDFTHHKILLVDDRRLQLGGRNLENSYHMDQNPLTAKYTFMDTDVRLEMISGGREMVRAYDEIFNYHRMLATLKEVRMHAPNDLSQNNEAMNKADELCKSHLDAQDEDGYRSCYEEEFRKHEVIERVRIAEMKRQMNEGARAYVEEYRVPELAPEFTSTFKHDFVIRPGSDSMIGYIENLHLNRHERKKNYNQKNDNGGFLVSPEDRTKTYGSSNGSDLAHGKNINYLIKNSFESVCKQAQEGGVNRIIIHNAYFLPPAGVYTEFAKMIDGTYNCKGVTVQMLTNSMETTDLSMMNIFGKYGLSTFLKFYKENRGSQSAKFEYYEYKPLSKDPKKNMSLHSKVFILGDHAFIGSLNIDPRSYHMDTNNGLFFYKVPEFTKEYIKNFDKILSNPKFVENRTDLFAEAKIDDYIEKDMAMINELLAKAGDARNKIPEQWRAKGKDFIVKQLRWLGEQTKRVLQKKKEKDADKLDNVLQLI